MPLLKNNNSVNERIGRIVLRQKESDKILSFNIVQSGTENRVVISVREFSKNHPVFTATTIYPVKKEITCRIPYEAYNARWGRSITATHQSLFRKEKQKELTKWIIMALR